MPNASPYGSLGYVRPGAKFAGDAPANRPYGYGADTPGNQRLQVLSKNVYQPTDAGDTAWNNWSQWNQGQANQNMSSHGIKPGSPVGAGSASSGGFGAMPGTVPGSGGAFAGTYDKLFPQQLTDISGNVVAAQHQQAGSLPSLIKPLSRPGSATDGGTLMQGAGAAGRASVAGDAARAQLQLDDTLANQQNTLEHAAIRQREQIAIANTIMRMLETQQNSQLQNAGTALGLAF